MQVSSTSPQDKSKKTKRIITLTAVILALIIGAWLATSMLFGPTKQDYRDVANAQTTLLASYSEYAQANALRDQLDFAAVFSGDANQGVQRGLSMSVSRTQLEEIEQREIAAAERIVKGEEYFSELIEQLGDRELVRLHKKFQVDRQEIYGEDGSFMDLAGSVAEYYRLRYMCQNAIGAGYLWQDEEAEIVLGNSKDCLELIDELKQGDKTVSCHDEFIESFRKNIQARVDLLRPMVDSGNIDYSAYDQLVESQDSLAIGGVSDRREIAPVAKISQSLKDNLGSVATQKERRARGSLDEL